VHTIFKLLLFMQQCCCVLATFSPAIKVNYLDS